MDLGAWEEGAGRTTYSFLLYTNICPALNCEKIFIYLFIFKSGTTIERQMSTVIDNSNSC